MRDSNLSYMDWLEILFLLLHDKKSNSVSKILRLSRQTRYETVAHAVKKIRNELAEIELLKIGENVDLLFFDKNEDESGTSSIDTPGIPTSLYLYLNNSKSRKNDTIRLIIPVRYIDLLIDKQVELKKAGKYRLKKLLRPVYLKKIPKPHGVKGSWKKKLKENLIKNVKGIHHNINILHFQGVLNEYCFRYNHRFETENLLTIFMEKYAMSLVELR